MKKYRLFLHYFMTVKKKAEKIHITYSNIRNDLQTLVQDIFRNNTVEKWMYKTIKSCSTPRSQSVTTP